MNSAFDSKPRHPGAVQIALMLPAVMFSFVLSARSQTSSATTSGKSSRDLSGVWAKPGQATEGARYSGTSNVRPDRNIKRSEIEMTAEGLEKWNYNRQGIKNPNQNGNIEIDPLRWCIPTGPTRPVTSAEPWEIRMFPDMVMILFERDHWTRRIYMDGRDHPKTPKYTWMGHSIGKWDGDTLVVDTVFTKPRVWLDSLGQPLTDPMRITELISRLDQNFLKYDTTFDDPKTYAKPWAEEKFFELLPEGFKIIEAVYCEEWLAVGETRGPEKVKYESYPGEDSP